MLKESQSLLLTDACNLPKAYQDSFFGLVHFLTLQVAQELELNLVASTPEDSSHLLEKTTAVLDRTLVYTQKVAACHDFFKERKTPYLNHPDIMAAFASKYATYQLLEAKVNQPKTILVESSIDLSNFIKTKKPGQRIVVKPEYGGMGDKIFFIDVLEDGQIRAAWIEEINEKITGEYFQGNPYAFYSHQLLKNNVDDSGKTRSTDNPQSWIAQDFLSLKTVSGLATDIRVIEQRDGFGVLQVSQIHGRKSAFLETPLTNLSKGGSVCQVTEILEGTGIGINDLIDCCRQVDFQLESATGQKIGEVGHDVAIVNSPEGFQLFYIEGNTMPGYVFSDWAKLRQASKPNISLLSKNDLQLLCRPLEYVSVL